jgi:ATP-binding cassette subfamily B protein
MKSQKTKPTNETSISLWASIQHFLRILKNYRLMMLVPIIILFFGMILEKGLLPLLFQNSIDTITSRTGQFPWILVSLYLICLILSKAIFRFAEYSAIYMESKASAELKEYAFERILQKGIHTFNKLSHGSILIKISRYANSFEKIYDTIAWEFMWIIAQLVIAILVMAHKAPIFSVLLLAWSILFITISVRTRAARDPLEQDENEKDSVVTGEISDVLSNIFAILSFGTTNREHARASISIQDHQKSQQKLWNYSNYERIVQAGLMILLEVPTIILILNMYYNNLLTIGEVVLIQGYVISILSSITGIGRGVQMLSKAKNDVGIFLDLINTEPDEESLSERLCNPDQLLSGNIAFNNVTYTYPEKPEPALNRLSLTIPQGTKVGIVGQTGAGKSTLVQLLLGLIRQESGTLTIGDTNTASVPTSVLRQSIAYVPQETALLHRSIRENIAYLKPDATDEEVELAARAACAHDFITEIPEGYNARVGERGVKLSGGQRQRITLARAILSDAKIVILDEATSALDVKTEHLIQGVLETAFAGKTLIVIAHRLSTIASLDKIMVLDNGVIAEMGSHHELLAKGGIYADLVEHQLASQTMI